MILSKLLTCILFLNLMNSVTNTHAFSVHVECTDAFQNQQMLFYMRLQKQALSQFPLSLLSRTHIKYTKNYKRETNIMIILFSHIEYIHALFHSIRFSNAALFILIIILSALVTSMSARFRITQFLQIISSSYSFSLLQMAHCLRLTNSVRERRIPFYMILAKDSHKFPSYNNCTDVFIRFTSSH